MKVTPKMKKIYADIQNHLFCMIPERFESIYLYASIIEQVHGMPIGEMFFYYFPKGILKKRPINVYEIPNKFNIEDETYSKIINELYKLIKQLREEFIETAQVPWTNLTIKIENFKFFVEYYYDDLTMSPYSNYERHILWRYKYLKEDSNTYNKKEKELIQKYLQENKLVEKKETYQEAIYNNRHKQKLDYETEDHANEENLDGKKEKNQILNVKN